MAPVTRTPSWPSAPSPTMATSLSTSTTACSVLGVPALPQGFRGINPHLTQRWSTRLRCHPLPTVPSTEPIRDGSTAEGMGRARLASACKLGLGPAWGGCFLPAAAVWLWSVLPSLTLPGSSTFSVTAREIRILLGMHRGQHQLAAVLSDDLPARGTLLPAMAQHQLSHGSLRQ